MCRSYEEQKEDAKQAKENPIFGTDLSVPISVVIERIRNEMVHTRGMIKDLERAYPGWKERVDHVEGLLTCGIVTLAVSQKEIIDYEIKTLDAERGQSFRFSPRGIGLDSCPGCFVCGGELREEGANHYLNNISGYVSSREEGQQIVDWFEKGARLDSREREPNYIQVKIGACDTHLPQLKKLNDITRAYGVIRQLDISDAINFVPVIETEEKLESE